MARMSREKQGWAHRLQPFMGTAIFAAGLTVLALVLRKGLDNRTMATAGMSGMMAMGGLSLLFRARISRGRAAVFAVGGLVLAGAAMAMATVP